MNIRKAVKTLVANVVKMYDNTLDHGKTHIVDVVKKALRYGRELKLSVREFEILMVAAVFHDIGLILGERKDHEIVAHDHVLTNLELKELFSDEEVDMIAKCCLYHRTSKKKDDEIPLLCKIIHDADNSVDINTIVKRGVATRMGKITDRSESSLQWVREDVVNYMKMKHGKLGYKKFYLELPERSEDDLKRGKDVIDNEEPELFVLIEKYINKLL